jgi:hypothetical protein
VLAAQLGHGHAALRLAQDAYDLGLGATALLNSQSPRSGRQENSNHANGWQTQAPSAVPFDPRATPPTALDAAGLA